MIGCVASVTLQEICVFYLICEFNFLYFNHINGLFLAVATQKVLSLNWGFAESFCMDTLASMIEFVYESVTVQTEVGLKIY